MLVAFLGGVLPSIIWLAFWLLEDKRDPEPKRFIIYTFIAGMCVIPFVLIFEKIVQAQAIAAGFGKESLLVLLLWATLEEGFKFGAAYIAALRWRVFDEPLDGVIYLITAALGFAALENMLFLASPLKDGLIFQTIVTGDLRFVGATLLHTLASGTIGLSLAYAFYAAPHIRILAAGGGVILAIALHTAFNFFILNPGGLNTFFIFMSLWLGIVAILLLIERVKNSTMLLRKNAYNQ